MVPVGLKTAKDFIEAVYRYHMAETLGEKLDTHNDLVRAFIKLDE